MIHTDSSQRDTNAFKILLRCTKGVGLLSSKDPSLCKSGIEEHRLSRSFENQTSRFDEMTRHPEPQDTGAWPTHQVSWPIARGTGHKALSCHFVSPDSGPPRIHPCPCSAEWRRFNQSRLQTTAITREERLPSTTRSNMWQSARMGLKFKALRGETFALFENVTTLERKVLRKSAQVALCCRQGTGKLNVGNDQFCS